MPYVVINRNGKKVNSPFVYTAEEVERLKKAKNQNLTLVNTTTRRVVKVRNK